MSRSSSTGRTAWPSAYSSNASCEALAQLDHPGLVTLHDGGTEPGPDGRTYVITDLVEGPTLATRMQRGPLRVGEIRTLAATLSAALAHVHARGFVHRDVKPANILLDHGREPRLADFGIARALDGTVATATGAVAGTAAYLAPEQVRGEIVGPPADVYALGLVLIEARTGRREYPGAMVESATARLYRRPVVPSGLPRDLAALLHAMTDPDPAARPTAATWPPSCPSGRGCASGGWATPSPPRACWAWCSAGSPCGAARIRRRRRWAPSCPCR